MPHSQHDEELAAAVAGLVTVITENLEKPSVDDRSYRVIRLSNELEVLLAHDPKADKASAALDVNVGNFSDETDIPGMAHAVEHLLFMGTETFPVENEYAQYVSANSGKYNACTGSTSTNYHFCVAATPANDGDPSDSNLSPLYGGLNRFSRFFTEPLFLADTLDRELKAIDSENNMLQRDDGWRLYQLFKSLANPNHPYSQFLTGNFEVLKTLLEARGINVREKFIEFYGKHYSANRMKLTVLGRESLEVLQIWVTKFFSPVVNKELAQNRWEDEQPLRTSELGLQIFAKPVKDSRELKLYFPFIDEESLYSSQPSRYLSHLIGHEGPGSIMYYIKSKGWANGVSAGAEPVCPGTPSIFEVQVHLTEDGLLNYSEILGIFFQYTALLRESPPQEWIFEELKFMDDVDFKFKQKTPAMEFTTETSSVMQKPLPRRWLLSGDGRLRKFEPKKIQEALERIRPSNFRMVIVSRNFPGNWDQKEKWYGTEYRSEKIPNDLMEQLEAAASVTPEERLPNLHLPHKNNFIPSQLELKREVAPRLIRNDERARIWWKKDDTFRVPKANVIAYLRSPLIYASSGNNVNARIFTDLVKDALEGDLYSARLAGFQYDITPKFHGLEIDMSGYNDKLLDVLKQVLTTMRDLEIKEERFKIVKERLTRAYNNWQLKSSYDQVQDYMDWLNSEPQDFLAEHLVLRLPSSTCDGVRQFQKQMLSNMHIEVCVLGNMNSADAIEATDMVVSTFEPRILDPAEWPIRRSLILPLGSDFVFNKTLQDPQNVDHCVEAWFYVGDKADGQVRAKVQLLDQMTREPAFDQLRTKEQLGYVVWSGARSFSTTYGFRILVQSERTPAFLNSRIEFFLNNFGKTLGEMGDTEFEAHKRSLIAQKLKKPQNLKEEFDQYWDQISTEYYDFERARCDAANVEALTKSVMVDFFLKYISPKSIERAKLSVYLHAQKKESGSEEAAEVSVVKVSGNTARHPVVIEDIHTYKASLPVSAGPRPAKDLSEYEDIDSKPRS